MKAMTHAVLAGAVLILGVVPAQAQLGLFTKDQRVSITRAWEGPRAADGRPLVPAAVLNRMRLVTAEEAWDVLRAAGYPLQFEGNWKTVHAAQPGQRLAGRAVTAVFMPKRKDLHEAVNANAAAEGRIGQGQNSWIIDTLEPGDVMVVDLFGKIDKGTIIGDNLGTSIYAKTGTGIVVDGAVRDVSGLSEVEGLIVYARDFHPSYLEDVTLVGINVPIRIGQATVLPGDVVLSDPDGLMFIPPQMAETVVERSEDIRLRDEWGHMVLREGTYTPGQIDTKWTPEIEAEFQAWKAKQLR